MKACAICLWVISFVVAVFSIWRAYGNNAADYLGSTIVGIFLAVVCLVLGTYLYQLPDKTKQKSSSSISDDESQPERPRIDVTL